MTYCICGLKLTVILIKYPMPGSAGKLYSVPAAYISAGSRKSDF